MSVLIIYLLPSAVSVSLRLSWNSDRGDSGDSGSVGCSGLCCQEEARGAGGNTEQAAQYAQHAQYAIHALDAGHAQPAKLQVRRSQKGKDRTDGYCCQKCKI